MNFDAVTKFYDYLPKLEDLKNILYPQQQREFVLLFAEELLEVETANKWIQQFSLKYQVQSGEKLKSIEEFPHHIANITNLLSTQSHKNLTLVVLGGGTVGDFGGFVASIYKRGIDLIHIPSTWLAAIDSAHGGKNALNVGSVKNQVGTFYPAKAVILVKELFASLSQDPVRSSLGELIKIGIVNSPSLIEFMKDTEAKPEDYLWELLPQAIMAKMNIALQDPYEKTGLRQQLNLGHSLGHVLETLCGWPHGWAVAQGLYFSLHWSLEKKIINKESHSDIYNFLQRFFAEKQSPQGESLPKLTEVDFLKVLAGDKKKMGNNTINFVFIQQLGKVVIEAVTEQEMMSEARRQGWL